MPNELATANPVTGEIVEQPIGSPLDMPPQAFRAAMDRRTDNRKALMAWVRAALVDGVDYGSVPTKRGPSKPSLRKPGAEKICGMLNVTVNFPNLGQYEQAAISGVEIKQIIIRCQLCSSGVVVAEGCGARTLAQDYGDINKALKMAEKSAHIDATLRLAGLSEVFTQDLEDMPGFKAAEEKPAPTPAEPQAEPSDLAGQLQADVDAPPTVKIPDMPDLTGAASNEGPLDEVAVKEGQTAKGPWRRYGLRMGQMWFGTFDRTLGAYAETLVGKQVRLYFKPGKKGSDCVHIQPR